jgi:hypothetical protein
MPDRTPRNRVTLRIPILIRRGAPAVSCSPVMNPSRSQRYMVTLPTPRRRSASATVTTTTSSLWVGTVSLCRWAGMPRDTRKDCTRLLVKGSPVPVRRCWRDKINAMVVSS